MIATADQLAAARAVMPWNRVRLNAATQRGPEPGDPSPAEIAAACLRIQRSWSDEERRRRATHFADHRNIAVTPGSQMPEGLTVQVIDTAELIGNGWTDET